MRKLYCCLIFVLFTTTINLLPARATVLYQTAKANPEEERLLNKLFKLAEVKKLDLELKKYKANASLMTWSTPTAANPYYEVTAGYNGPQRYETRYTFRIKKSNVNKADIEPYIMVLDIVSGDYISLAKFRSSHRN